MLPQRRQLIWHVRLLLELGVWMFRTPETITWEFMRYFALPHVAGIVAEVGTWVWLLFVTNGRIGPQAALIAGFPYYVYHLVAWPFQPHENGRLPSCLPWVVQCLVFPLVIYVSQTERTSLSLSLSFSLSLSLARSLKHSLRQRLSAPRDSRLAPCTCRSQLPRPTPRAFTNHY